MSSGDAAWIEDLGWTNEPCIRWGSRSPTGTGNFERDGEAHCASDCSELCKMAETIEMPLGFELRWAHVLGGGPDPLMGRCNMEDGRAPIVCSVVSPAKMAEPLGMLFGLRT